MYKIQASGRCAADCDESIHKMNKSEEQNPEAKKPKKKPRITQAESRRLLERMCALYDCENQTLEQVGDAFGISRQAVQERSKRAGFVTRPMRGRLKRVIGKQVLEDLYVGQKLTIKEVASRLQTSYPIVNRELVRHGIEKRSPSVLLRKYPQLWEIKIGERLLIEQPAGIKNVYRNLHAKAAKIDIGITVHKTEAGMFEVTRLR